MKRLCRFRQMNCCVFGAISTFLLCLIHRSYVTIQLGARVDMVELKSLHNVRNIPLSSMDPVDRRLRVLPYPDRFNSKPLQDVTAKSNFYESNANWTETVLSSTLLAPPTCTKKRNIVCIKVHKAASTTAVAILERYGYKKNMTLAVRAQAKFGPHILSSTKPFFRQMVYQYQRTYNMLTNHVRFNRAEMDVVVPNATYITIIRHPLKHFESAFVYFSAAKHLNISKESDPLAAFFEKPEKYFNQKIYFWFQLHSGQIFDLGLDHKYHTGPNVAAMIQRLSKELDYVMIADHFDESLVLLRRHLCLDWQDIVYLPDNFRIEHQKMNISNEVRQKIEIWNWADMTLYQYFYRLFWDKVNSYGPSFTQDLKYFRSLLAATREKCTTGNIKKKPRDAHGVRTLELRQNASEFCKDLLLGDVDYTKMFRNRQNRTLYNLPKFWDR